MPPSGGGGGRQSQRRGREKSKGEKTENRLSLDAAKRQKEKKQSNHFARITVLDWKGGGRAPLSRD